jgi:2'-5' RNA ligase
MSREPKGKRCFLALALDEAARADMADLMREIEMDGMHKTSPENLHITLKFLGDMSDQEIEPVMGAVQEVAAAHRPFELSLLGLEYLPNPRRPRVLAAQFECTVEMNALFEHLELALSEIGFPMEGRSCHPHVTLGRYRRPPRTLPGLPAIDVTPMSLPVQTIMLMQSTLGGSRPVYSILAHWPLHARS